MSSIRKSFFSCQTVDITLSNSCFFFCHSNAVFVSVYWGVEPLDVRTSTFFGSHFQPCLSYCMQLFFFFSPLPDLPEAYIEQTLPWLVTGQLYFIIQTLTFPVLFVCLPSFERLNLCSLFFVRNKVPQHKRGNQSLSSVVFSASFHSLSIILLIINSQLYNYSYKIISSLSVIKRNRGDNHLNFRSWILPPTSFLKIKNKTTHQCGVLHAERQS